MADEKQKKKKHFGKWIAAAVLVVLLAIGIVPRILRNSQLQASAAAEKSVLPIVEVVKPAYAPDTTTVDVPGSIEPIEQTSVNARATGYADQVLVDIGDKVTAGQTLAIITAPDTNLETDQARAELLQAQAALSQSQANEASAQETVAQDEATLLHTRASLLTARATLAQLRDELAQAENAKGEQVASLKEAQANLDLYRITNVRNQHLASEGFVAQQMADQTEAQYKVGSATVTSGEASVAASDSSIRAAQQGVETGIDNVAGAQYDVQAGEATVAAAQSTVRSDEDAVNEAMAGVNADQANLLRMSVLQNYEKVTAPFSGVVTARNIDPGAYISGGSSESSSTSIGSNSAGAGSTGAPAGGSSSYGSSADTTATASTVEGGGASGLFTIANLDRLRIYISLPQSDAGLLSDGDPATISVPSVSPRSFPGTVAHSTVALDPNSRSLVAEILVDNPKGLLRPGMFADVQLTVPQPSGILIVPDSALVTGAGGTQLTLVEPGSKLHFQDVQVGNDDGKNIQILRGLKPTDRVVTSPANGFREGEQVQVVAPSGPKRKGGGRNGS